jgi:hypothetical protein
VEAAYDRPFHIKVDISKGGSADKIMVMNNNLKACVEMR